MRHARRIPRTAFLTLLLALCAAGCGGDDPAPAETAATPVASEPEQEQGLVLDTEEEYHQPPQPATGGIGDTITLTGTNLGVRLEVTVTKVKAGERRTTVGLRLVNTGIAVFDSQLTKSFVVDADGRRARLSKGVKAKCSDGLQDAIWLDVGEERTGCLVFPSSGSRPARLRLALEQVPAAEGGRWSLR
jgi:hypothetical protein